MKTGREIEKRIFAVLLAVCIVLPCFWMNAINAQTADTGITISAVCGFKGYAKYGRYMPAEITVKTDRDIAGLVRIIVPADDGNNNYAYEYLIQAERGSETVIKTEIPLLSKYTLFYIEVVGQDGKVYASTEAKVQTAGGSSSELFVGVLSEDEQAGNVFHRVNVGEYNDSSYPYIMTRGFSLSPEDITERFESIDFLDVLVIDKLSFGKLSEEQTASVLEWLKNGGALILETDGKSYLYPEEGYELTEAVEARPYLWIQKQYVQEGIIGYCHVDARDLNLMEYAVDSKAAISGALIGQVLSADTIVQILEADHLNTDQSSYDAIASMLNVGIGKKLPRISLYMFVILLYLLLVGPVLYYFLRKQEKLLFLGRAVTVLAVLFSVLIYAMGSVTRFKEPFVRYATVWYMEGEQVRELTYLDVKSPVSKKYYMGIAPEYAVKPITAGGSYFEEEGILASEKSYNVGLLYAEGYTGITIEKMAPFSSQYFQLEKNRTEKNLSGWGGEVTYFNEKAEGYLYNKSEETLKNVVLLLNGQIICFGSLEPGESREISEGTQLFYSPNTYAKAAAAITGLSEFSEKEKGSKNHALLLQRTNLYEYYIKKYDTSSENDAVLLAFLPESQGGLFQAETSYDTQGVTMLYKKLETNTTIGRYTYQNLTSKDISNIDDEPAYNAQTNSTYSSSIRLSYNLGPREGLRKIRFAARCVEEGNTYYSPFSGETYFYNPSTLTYDLVNLNKTEFYISTIEKYLTEREGNFYLIVQYTQPEVQEGAEKLYEEIRLPLVSVIRE